VRHDLRAAALLEEGPLEQICRRNRLAMTERKPQVSHAGVEVVGEALHHCGQVTLVGMDEVLAQQRGERWRRRFIAGPGPHGDLRPLRLGRLASEIPHPMGQASLAERSGEAGEAGLDRANEPGRTVSDDQERIGQAAAFEVVEERRIEERRTARRVLLRPRRRVQ